MQDKKDDFNGVLPDKDDNTYHIGVLHGIKLSMDLLSFQRKVLVKENENPLADTESTNAMIKLLDVQINYLNEISKVMIFDLEENEKAVPK